MVPRPDVIPHPDRTPRPWRERLPEVLATVGATLVALAVAGFLSSRWESITQLQKAMVLATGAAGLTAAGLWADRYARRAVEYVVGLFWATATMLVAASVTLAASTTWPGYGRLTIAAGGLAGLVHAVVLWARRRESVTQQVAMLGAALYAAGPFGASVHDRFDAGTVARLGEPVVGFLDPTVDSSAFLLTGLVHLAIGVAWLALARITSGRAATIAKTTAGVTLAFAALELNVLDSPVGAVAALAVVLGFLVYGLVDEDGVLVVAGAIGAFAAGVRVLVALFSGEVVVTLLLFAGGLTLLAWAVRAMRQRQSDAETEVTR